MFCAAIPRRDNLYECRRETGMNSKIKQSRIELELDGIKGNRIRCSSSMRARTICRLRFLFFSIHFWKRNVNRTSMNASGCVVKFNYEAQISRARFLRCLWRLQKHLEYSGEAVCNKHSVSMERFLCIIKIKIMAVILVSGYQYIFVVN